MKKFLDLLKNIDPATIMALVAFIKTLPALFAAGDAESPVTAEVRSRLAAAGCCEEDIECVICRCNHAE